MARKPRMDGFLSQAHLVCMIWNVHMQLFGSYQPGGSWEVSQEDLAEMSRIGRATVQRAINELVANDCLTVIHQKPENAVYLDDKEPDEKRGKVPDHYLVTQEQLLRMASRLYENDTDLVIIQDPTGRVHLGYYNAVIDSILSGLVIIDPFLPAFGYSTDPNLYFTNELEVYSERRGTFVPLDLADDEIQ